MKRLFDRTFLKFLLVGVANTLFGTAVMFGCYNLLGLNYWISSAANYVCGSILSYFLNRHFTFENRARGFSTVWRFVVNILVCYLVAYGIAKPLVRMALSGQGTTIQENAAMLVGMVLFTLLNYFGQRFFAFRAK
jgi:putative flippase GtrA